MRSGKGVASSHEPRSVLRLGTWLRIVLSFFSLPPIAQKLDWSRVWKEGGESLHRGWIYLHIAGRREFNGERGWCKAAITVRRVRLFDSRRRSRRVVGNME